MITNLRKALDRFKLGSEANTQQRKREIDALRFQVPDLCWPDDVKNQRKPQILGGVAIPQRPMLSIPSLDQPIQLVLNAEKAAHLGVGIHPLSDDAEEETAEVIQGLYRRIEVESRASLARSWAFERAVKAGRGYYRVMTERDPDSDDSFDQRIAIKRILQQASVVLDPFSQEPDGSDGDWAFLVNDMPWDTYKRRYPNSKMANFSEEELGAIGIDTPEWISGSEGASRAVRVAEYYRLEYEHTRRVLLDDGTEADELDIPEGRTARVGEEARSRNEDKPILYWSTINAIEELEPRQEMDGRYIPIIPVIGRELIPFGDERRWVGMIEPNKDAVRLLNYSASSAVEMASLESKAPYTMVEGQEEGHEEEWQLANVRSFPYLRYRNVSLNGTPAPPPQRTQIDTSRLGPSMLLLQQAREFIHQGTGAFESALGQQTSSAKSGKAIQALQNQHETGSSHFIDNLAEISMTYEAKVILDLIPHIYDRPGRIARILDKEDEIKTVMLNTPFTMDPETKRPRPIQEMNGPPSMGMMNGMPPQMGGLGGQPLQGAGVPDQPIPMGGAPGPSPEMGGPMMGGLPPQGPPPPEPGMMPGSPQMGAGPGGLMPNRVPGNGSSLKALHYDLNKGRYGVTVSIGRSYKSRREEGADEMGQLFQSNPSLFPILGDIYLKFRDFPGHLEASERVKKMLPPPLQPDADGLDAEQLKQQLEEAGQMVEQLTKALEEKTKWQEMDAQKIQADAVESQKDREAKVEMEKMRNETQLAVTAMKVRSSEAGAIFAAEVERVGTDATHEFDATQQADQQHHLQQMAAQNLAQSEEKLPQDQQLPADPTLETLGMTVPLGGQPIDQLVVPQAEGVSIGLPVDPVGDIQEGEGGEYVLPSEDI
tara:strand:+ start:423 stop:3065 length:2643 start_codon:yes stop_codon:yes gene_type:complete